MKRHKRCLDDDVAYAVRSLPDVFERRSRGKFHEPVSMKEAPALVYLKALNLMAVQLNDLVETSRRVSETSGRLEKIGLLAELLKRLAEDEIAMGVLFLRGSFARGGYVLVGPSSEMQHRRLQPVHQA